MTCDGDGGNVSAAAESPSDTETFYLERNNGNRIHIKLKTGTYLQVWFHPCRVVSLPEFINKIGGLIHQGLLLSMIAAGLRSLHNPCLITTNAMIQVCLYEGWLENFKTIKITILQFFGLLLSCNGFTFLGVCDIFRSLRKNL